MSDLVNNPSHYCLGRFQAIDVIEDAISRSPDPILANCQGQVLKYILRMWDKDTPQLNAEKAQWYLSRLLMHLERQ